MSHKVQKRLRAEIKDNIDREFPDLSRDDKKKLCKLMQSRTFTEKVLRDAEALKAKGKFQSEGSSVRLPGFDFNSDLP